MKTNLIYAAFALLFCFAITSCEKSDNNPETVLENNLLRSAEKYAELVEKRNDGDFNIEDIKRNGNMLTIKVKGGCNQDDFHVVWDGSIMFSNPGQINLVLNNKSQEDCGLEKKFDINVDLSKVVGKYDAKDFIFNVANGSKKQDKSLNPNGSITVK
ncbi:hypothetical protein EDC17_100492 [Sphingobacterium alimentarium]|uniref:Lipoprotein n=1 Tax=Sphingobacterium alimentarium TaxID=797292 RepID=A0A4R3VW20_9SPHI|nr:hypothetical protein [Sphingobacterium alimentarium]TCV19570.1 hypothetical protein EDC17_100492 [Sphingobacterium alimentarium]